ncbi:MAG TPA: DUF2207 domain-containing protein, partial [Candidatus Methanomethylicus sp.]|nr:DUF2207 domain-containing protein [Candidatus Methanomethylicus sp.]
MAETRQIAALLVMTLTIGALGVFFVYATPSLFEGNVVVDSYRATLYGNGTLVEEFTYAISASGQYRMLYRSWDAPLTLGPLARSHVELVSIECPAGTVPYIKDNTGTVTVLSSESSSSIISSIRSMAELNEAGCYAPSYFEAGRYAVKYIFNVYPPIEYDSEFAHLNLKLASVHLPYRNVAIDIMYPGQVVAVYPHPPTLSVVNSSGMLTLSGSSANDELLEVELLLAKDALSTMPGFQTYVSGVQGQTITANMLYSAEYWFAGALRTLASFLALLLPFMLLQTYYRYGKENIYAVPKFLSFVPNPERKPWLVNLIFKGDAVDFDENAFFATLLHLHIQGKIKMEQSGNDLVIRIIGSPAGD